MAALLCAATSRSRVLLILDDLDWADKPTHLLLRHLLRHPQLTRLLVVGTVATARSGASTRSSTCSPTCGASAATTA